MGKSSNETPPRIDSCLDNSSYIQESPVQREDSYYDRDDYQDEASYMLSSQMTNLSMRPSDPDSAKRCICCQGMNSCGFRQRAGRDTLPQSYEELSFEQQTIIEGEEITGRALGIIRVVDDLLDQATVLKSRLMEMITHFQTKICKCAEKMPCCGVQLQEGATCMCSFHTEAVRNRGGTTDGFLDAQASQIPYENQLPRNTADVTDVRSNYSDMQDETYTRSRTAYVRYYNSLGKGSSLNAEFQEPPIEREPSDASMPMIRSMGTVDLRRGEESRGTIDQKYHSEPRLKGGESFTSNRSKPSDENCAGETIRVSDISKKLLSIQQEIESLRTEVAKLTCAKVCRRHDVPSGANMLEEIMSSNLIGKADEIKLTLTEIKSDCYQKLSQTSDISKVGEKTVHEKVEREIRRTHPDFSRTVNQVKLTKGEQVLDNNVQRTTFDQTYQANIETKFKGDPEEKSMIFKVSKRTDETIHHPRQEDEYRQTVRQSEKMIKTDQKAITKEDAIQEQEVKYPEKRVIETRRIITRTEEVAGHEPTKEVLMNVRINRVIDNRTGEVTETLQKLDTDSFTDYHGLTTKEEEKPPPLQEEVSVLVTKNDYDDVPPLPSMRTALVSDTNRPSRHTSEPNPLFLNSFEQDRNKPGYYADSTTSASRPAQTSRISSRAASYFEVIAEDEVSSTPMGGVDQRDKFDAQKSRHSNPRKKYDTTHENEQSRQNDQMDKVDAARSKHDEERSRHEVMRPTESSFDNRKSTPSDREGKYGDDKASSDDGKSRRSAQRSQAASPKGSSDERGTKFTQERSYDDWRKDSRARSPITPRNTYASEKSRYNVQERDYETDQRPSHQSSFDSEKHGREVEQSQYDDEKHSSDSGRSRRNVDQEASKYREQSSKYDSVKDSYDPRRSRRSVVERGSEGRRVDSPKRGDQMYDDLKGSSDDSKRERYKEKDARSPGTDLFDAPARKSDMQRGTYDTGKSRYTLQGRTSDEENNRPHEQIESPTTREEDRSRGIPQERDYYDEKSKKSEQPSVRQTRYGESGKSSSDDGKSRRSKIRYDDDWLSKRDPSLSPYSEEKSRSQMPGKIDEDEKNIQSTIATSKSRYEGPKSRSSRLARSYGDERSKYDIQTKRSDRSISSRRRSQWEKRVDGKASSDDGKDMRRDESIEQTYEEIKRKHDGEDFEEVERRPDETYDDDKSKYGKQRSESTRYSRDEKRSRFSVPEQTRDDKVLGDESSRYSPEETKRRDDEKDIYSSQAKRSEYRQSTYDGERSRHISQKSRYEVDKDRSEDGKDRQSAGSSRFDEDISKVASEKSRYPDLRGYREIPDGASAYSEPKSRFDATASRYKDEEVPTYGGEMAKDTDHDGDKADYLEKRLERSSQVTSHLSASPVAEKDSEQSNASIQRPICLEGPYYYKVHSRSYVLTDSTLDRICAERAKDREKRNNRKNEPEPLSSSQGRREPQQQSKPTTPRDQSRSESPDRSKRSTYDTRKQPQYHQSKLTTPRDQSPGESPDWPRTSINDPRKSMYEIDRSTNPMKSKALEQAELPNGELKIAPIQHHSGSESSDRRHSSYDERTQPRQPSVISTRDQENEKFPQFARRDDRVKTSSSRSQILSDRSEKRSEHKLQQQSTADSTKSRIRFDSRYETSDLSTTQYEESSSTDPKKPGPTLQEISSQKVSELIMKHDLQVAPDTESRTSKPARMKSPPRDTMTASRYSRQSSGRNVFNSRQTESIKMTKSPFTIASETYSPEAIGPRTSWRSNRHSSIPRSGRPLSQDRQSKSSTPAARQISPSRTMGGEEKSNRDSSPTSIKPSSRAASTARSARFHESFSSRSPSVSPQRSSSQKRSPSRVPACGRKNCGALGAVGLSVRSIDVGSIHKVIDELSGRRPSTDFFVSVLPEKIHSKTFRVNIIDKETGDLLGYFYIDEEKFHVARTQGVFDNYLALYVLNSVGSITDFKSTVIPKALKKYQCLTKCACAE